MEKYQAAFAAETTKGINSLVAGCQYARLITQRVESFCFSASQRKAKKLRALRALRLCGEKLYKDPFRGGY